VPYCEHLPPYLYVLYPERDWEHETERLENIDEDMNLKYDLFAEAKRSTLAEFTYACCKFIQAYAAQFYNKPDIFADSDIKVFAARHLKEHSLKYFDRANVRVVPLTNLCTIINEIDTRLRNSGQKSAPVTFVFRLVFLHCFVYVQIRETECGTATTQKGELKVVDTYRLKFPHGSSWRDKLRDDTCKSVMQQKECIFIVNGFFGTGELDRLFDYASARDVASSRPV
jgi:hypothetical protein